MERHVLHEGEVFKRGVSIPFKRETSWKGKYKLAGAKKATEFQFPSNGKPHGKPAAGALPVLKPEFQFPSNGKPHGKSEIVGVCDTSCVTSFQFPSNGKPHGKFGLVLCGFKVNKVSIPFKRETSWKVVDVAIHGRSHLTSFNSLQTGNLIESIKTAPWLD